VFDLVKKTMLAGIGLTLKTKEEVQNLAKELVEKGKMTEKEGKAFLDDLLKKYDDTRGKLESKVEKTVQATLKKTNLVTADELKSLKKEIQDLRKEIAGLKATIQKSDG
jgi:polyhydroxyalkanoate synthesis regulator phasin